MGKSLLTAEFGAGVLFREGKVYLEAGMGAKSSCASKQPPQIVHGSACCFCTFMAHAN